MRLRVAVSAIIGLCAGSFCWFLMVRLHQGSADFTWAIRSAQHLISRQNPYDTPLEQYPVTAAFFALPFVRTSPELAAGLFFGISSGLLAFGASRYGFHRLFIFLAYPYWAALLTAQWSPLIAAGAFLPLALPATMAKPQIGIPVFLTHLSRRGILACLLVAGLTFIAMPSWPRLWAGQFGYYEHFIPLAVVPGFLVLLAPFFSRDRDTALLVLTAAMPQRWFFDAFILWLIPQSRKEILATVACSWGAGIWRWYHMPRSFQQVGRWAVIFIYLPMLGVVLVRAVHSRRMAARQRREPGVALAGSQDKR